jgi:adenylosuccinate synthase
MKKTLRMGDLLHLDEAVKKRLVTMVDSKNLIMEGSYGAKPIDVEEMWAWLQKYAAIFKDYICDAGMYLDEADREGKKILFEAQLGALRDIDFGIYPYTTSSNVIGAYAPIGAGIPGHKLDNSIGIMKAYSSCVGDGPFTAELAMTEEEKHFLREAGHEYGAATGRPRRVGPVDLVASRYGVFCQGCDEVAITLLDVLDYMEQIPMVTAYRLSDGTLTDRFPMGEALDTAQPVVEYLPGWHCDITAARRWEDLPKEAQDYILALEKAVNCKITYISVGAEREAYIHRT